VPSRDNMPGTIIVLINKKRNSKMTYKEKITIKGKEYRIAKNYRDFSNSQMIYSTCDYAEAEAMDIATGTDFYTKDFLKKGEEDWKPMHMVIYGDHTRQIFDGYIFAEIDEYRPSFNFQLIISNLEWNSRGSIDSLEQKLYQKHYLTNYDGYYDEDGKPWTADGNPIK